MDKPAGVRVSVCMAAYNGAEHIGEQIESILSELGPGDELVVVDDASTDKTRQVVSDVGDSRIRLIPSPINRGYVRTFEAALSNSRGQYLFLSDQDDVWIPGRVQRMMAALQDAEVVAGNFSFFGQQPRAIESIRLRSSDSQRRWANLLALWVGYRPYYGCAMAMRRSVLPLVLPFPAFLTETHDQWIAMVGNLLGRMRHLEEDTLQRRLHDANTSPKQWRSLREILRARLMLLRAFLVAVGRTRKGSRTRAGRSA